MGLRVGLTGGLGSGKTTVARIFGEFGAHIISADELGRQLMEPGTAVFEAIVMQFGLFVVGADGRLNRPELARVAFGEGRVEELNAIVHPATIARQGEIAEEIFAKQPDAMVIVESALIFETKYGETKSGEGWRERFDRMILVTAPDELKVQRFVARSGAGDRTALEAEARRRLAQMIPDEIKVPQCDFVIQNDASLVDLRAAVLFVWKELSTLAW